MCRAPWHRRLSARPGASSSVPYDAPALTEAAPAKLNLFLRVVGRRPDGYHLLDSLAGFADVGDRLEAAPAEALSLVVEGPFAAGLAAEADNLVLRAARLLAAEAGVEPVAALRLDKRLPVASGIGGGSADAAAALRVLARLWRIEIDGVALQRIALLLGADVPVCIASQPARMGGIGEALTPAPALPAAGLVLANPGQAVPTPAVFRARTPGFSTPADLPRGWDSVAAMAADLSRLGNDLQAPAVELCPAIADVLAALAALPGCLLAQMSGSGATCFALFADVPTAVAAAAGLGRPDWWVWGGALRR